MTALHDVSEMLKEARRGAKLSQQALASRAGVARTTVARMETLAKGDMSVSVLVRLLAAAGYELKLVKAGHQRTIEGILNEQRSGQGVTAMAIQAFDVSAHLSDAETIRAYLSAALEDPNPDAFLLALSNVAKARGVIQLAAAAGVEPGSH